MHMIIILCTVQCSTQCKTMQNNPMQNNAEQPNANNYCTVVAYHESFLLLQGWWGGPCTALQMWPILAGRKSGVKVVNCVHDSQGDQIGHLHPAAHHSHSTFSWGTLQQGTAHEMRVISIQCSSITNIHTIIYHVQSNTPFTWNH